MRRCRRGRSAGHEFGNSGEDSFVAVVVTKLTGALLFILLLTMVIMALIPRAAPDQAAASSSRPLQILTQPSLPEAIAGRSYAVTLAATGGRGRLRWELEGALPDGLAFDAERGTLSGVPTRGQAGDHTFVVRARSESDSAAQTVTLNILVPEKSLGSTDRRQITLSQWVERGFGFVVIAAVWMIGLSIIGSVERWSMQPTGGGASDTGRRFLGYRIVVSAFACGAAIGLIVWMRG